MAKHEINASFILYTQDATLKSFWRKRALLSFLSSIDSCINTSYFDETKHDFLISYFNKIKNTENGKRIIFTIATNLIKMIDFPDLKGMEDSSDKIEKAKASIRTLNKYFTSQDRQFQENQQQAEKRKQHKDNIDKKKAFLQKKESLKDSFYSLSKEAGTQEAGYQFETWIYKLMVFNDIQAKRSYKDKTKRQIDGFINVDGTPYLLEVKNTKNLTSITDVDSFKVKIDNKADNTMGIMISMMGFSHSSIESTSEKGTKILLLDYNHFNYYFTHDITFSEIVQRIRRHAAQTGQSYLLIKNF